MLGDCGGTDYKNGTVGTIITSPNYPNQYPKDEDCSTIITLEKGQNVTLAFLYFDVGKRGYGSSDCRYGNTKS